MRNRGYIVGLCCAVLSGCSHGGGEGSFAFPQLSAMALPEIQVWGVPLYGEAPQERLVALQPQQLTADQTAVVRLAVQAAFPNTARLTFFPLRSGRRSSDTLSVCGMATVHWATGGSDTRLFRGDLERAQGGGPFLFELKQISGANADALTVLADCREQNLA